MDKNERSQARAEKKEKRRVFRRLAYRALPEIQSFQILTKLAIMLLLLFLTRFATDLLESTSDGIITTANLSILFRSWQGLVVLLLGFLVILIYIATDLLAQIVLCDNILEGRPSQTFRTLGRGFIALPKFLTPAGLPAIIFIFLAIPLIGVGFKISLMRSFRIPSFIMDVISTTPAYLALYLGALLVLLWLFLRYQFTLHGVMIDGLTVREAKKQSVRLVRANWKTLIPKMTLAFLKVYLICGLIGLLVNLIPQILMYIEEIGSEKVRRFLILFALMLGLFLTFIVTLLSTGYLMLFYTKLYKTYSKEEPSCPPRPKKGSYVVKSVLGAGIIFILAFLALFMTHWLTDDILKPVDVGYVAHRAGGTLASENSLDGLEAAIEHGAFGSEIDIQRTKDGYYIINHDGNFKRLAGESRAPQDMTFDEVRALTFADTTGNGKIQRVPTLEEMLDTIKGREKLFIELKGKTADRRMVDDVVKIVKEKDCLDDVVLISLDYDVINYAETTYPEFETGVLLFGKYGSLHRVNADYVLLEEESATRTNILLLHAAGKKAGVWTLNDSAGLSAFLDSTIDVIITDSVSLAETLKDEIRDKNVDACLISRFETIKGSRNIFCDFMDRIYLGTTYDAETETNSRGTMD